MSKGSDTPPAPDYTGAAREQSQASKEIAIGQTFANRPQINTPWGQQTWQTGADVDPATGQPVTTWTSDINLTPGQQDALNAQESIQKGRSQAAETLLGQATGAFQTPFNWDTMPERANTPQATTTGTQALQRGVGQTGQQTGVQQYGLDLSAPGQTTFSTNEPAFAQQRQDIQNALFDQMRPEHQRQEDATRTRMGNMGLPTGGEAYNRELERLQGTQANERFNAMNAAGAEQARMQQALLSQQSQAFGQDTQAQQAQNAAAQAQFGQGLQAGQFTNQALQNQFGQGLQAGQFGNQASQDTFNQGMMANNQNFNQQLQGANFQNTNRQQAIAEEAQRRGMPLNELNALLTSQQVNMPAMPGFQSATPGQAPQLLQAAQAQGNYGMNAAQMDAQNGAQTGQMIASAAMAAAAAY